MGKCFMKSRVETPGTLLNALLLRAYKWNIFDFYLIIFRVYTKLGREKANLVFLKQGEYFQSSKIY